MEIDKKLLEEIEEYCKYNEIGDVEKEINKILRKGFNIIKFGVSPFRQDNEIQEEEKLKVVENVEDVTPKEKKVGRPRKVEEKEKQELPTQTKRKIRIIKN